MLTVTMLKVVIKAVFIPRGAAKSELLHCVGRRAAVVSPRYLLAARELLLLLGPMFANLLIEFGENTMKQTGKRLPSFNRAAVLLWVHPKERERESE